MTRKEVEKATILQCPIGSTVEVPFLIGQQMWAPVVHPQRVTIPCPICVGERRVIVILGSGEHLSVECEACAVGLQPPRGVIEEWNNDPGVEPFTIASVKSMWNNQWMLESTTGSQQQHHELYTTETKAMAQSVAQCNNNNERNLQMRQHKRAGVKKVTWSIRYHHEHIKDLERQITWHRERVRRIQTISVKSDD